MDGFGAVCIGRETHFSAWLHNTMLRSSSKRRKQALKVQRDVVTWASLFDSLRLPPQHGGCELAHSLAELVVTFTKLL